MSVRRPDAILLVDDDENLLSGFRRRLGADFPLRTFSSPIEAMEAVRRDGPFAVVVSDMRMPEMDGLTLLQHIRRLHPESVGVMLTGDGDQELAVKALNEGYVFRFLKKPCRSDDLRTTLDEALVEYQSRCSLSGFQYTLSRNDESAIEVEAGAGCSAVTGYVGADFIEQPQQWETLSLPEDRDRVTAFYAAAWGGQAVDPIEYRLRRNDHRIIWVRNTLLGCQTGGSICRLQIQGQLQDITERKRAELELEQSRRRYEKMVANVPGLVFQCMMRSDGEFQFVFVSHSCLELLGVTGEQICADNGLFFQAFSAADRTLFFSTLAESAERLTPLLWQGRHAVGSVARWYQMTARPERLADGNVLWDGLLMDITEQKHAEQKAEFLARFPRENPNPVLRLNAEGRIVYANDAAGRMLEIWNRQSGQIVPQDVYEGLVHARHAGKPITLELRCRDHYYAAVLAPLGADGDVNFYARDITKIKIAELEIRNVNRELVEHNRLKSEFISTVTHELRTPLCIFRNILSNALAGVHGPISKGLKENLEMAQQGVERLSRIISDFLDISRIEAGKLKLDLSLCSLNELIVETCRSLKVLAAAKKIRIETTLPTRHVFAWVDRDRIVQCLVNLIGNAIKFIPMRGRIHVRLEHTPKAVTVFVEDNGPGLSQDEAARVFDRFVQARILKGPGRHGTGLGLAITRELVDLHGGQIRVQSRPGQGCTFAFTVPRERPQSPSQEPPENAKNDHLVK